MNKNKHISLAIAIILLVGTCTGCGQAATVDIYHPVDVASPTADNVVIDLALEMVPLTESPAVFSIPVPTASGKHVTKNSKAEIDYSNKEDGYIMVRYLQRTTKQLRVIVKGPNEAQYTYTLKSSGDYEVFPLSDGNGNYTVSVYEQIEGTKYSTANTASFSTTLNDEFAPFIRPNQYVNYNADNYAVSKAAELVAGATDMHEAISSIYNYVIGHLSYDKVLAANVQSGYLPDIDEVLRREKGICFDYASVMTAMLRSQGILTKLVVGYAGQAYHAWINVYSEDEGWINEVIFFDGEAWKLMDPTFASTGNQSSSVMNYIGDGKNYSAKFLY